MFALITKEIAQSSVPVTVEPALDNLALWERAKHFKVLWGILDSPFFMLSLKEVCPLKGWDLEDLK